MVCHGLYPVCNVGQITLQNLYLSIKLLTFCSLEKFFFFFLKDIRVCATDRWYLVWIWSLMLWIINAFSFSVLNIWQSGCEAPWANFSTSTGGLWHLEHLRKGGKSVHWCTKREYHFHPRKRKETLKNLCSFHSRINRHRFSALILQKATERCHSLLNSII